jgi:ribosome-interacting GTPase 1
LDLLDQVPHYVPISAKDEWNLDDLMAKIWEYLNLIRIYTKPKGQIPDYDQPVILHRDHSGIQDFCGKLHKQLIKDFAYAKIWGLSAKHNPQKVGKEH